MVSAADVRPVRPSNPGDFVAVVSGRDTGRVLSILADDCQVELPSGKQYLPIHSLVLIQR